MAHLIQPNGDVTEVFPNDGETFTLAELQGYVGGKIETVPTPKRGQTLLVNEDGIRLGFERNQTATDAAVDLGKDNYLVGPVLLCKGKEFD